MCNLTASVLQTVKEISLWHNRLSIHQVIESVVHSSIELQQQQQQFYCKPWRHNHFWLCVLLNLFTVSTPLLLLLMMMTTTTTLRVNCCPFSFSFFFPLFVSLLQAHCGEREINFFTANNEEIVPVAQEKKLWRKERKWERVSKWYFARR